MTISRRTLALLLAACLVAPLAAQDAPKPAGKPRAPIAEALRVSSDDVREFNDHVVTLSSPFMEGRVPGSRGMEIAREYMDYWFKQAGLTPAFPDRNGDAGKSWRQPFELRGTIEVADQFMAVGGETLRPDTDFTVLGMGKSGEVEAEAVFAGYAIRRGPDGYSSFGEDDDFEGKIVVALRWEPMDENGKSLWAGDARPWTGRTSFAGKLRSLSRLNAKAIVIVDTPGAADPRAGTILKAGSGSAGAKVPVLMMSGAAAKKMFTAAGKSWDELHAQANEGRAVTPLGIKMKVRAGLERKPLIAENVGGMLRGKGALADEYIVIGANLDHLGMGEFGSRSGPGKLHPGADDNASGSAAVIMLAEKLAKLYDELPEGKPARSVVFVGFDAEESGLNGARYYVNNPVAPLDKHALMINFDMIGRIKDKRLSVSGANSAEGLSEFVEPMFEKSPLDIVQPRRMFAGSDHLMFYQKEVPVLFGIIADFHGDYHTPRDVSWKINRVDAVHTIELFKDIAYGIATNEKRFPFKGRSRRP